jgi:predicted kinase
MISLYSLLNEVQGKPKAIFMAGPAGSGKSYINKDIIPSNFNTINIDDTYEEMLKSSGIGMKLTQMSPEDLSQAAKLMGQAQKITKEKFSQLSKELKNLVIDGTGAASNPLLKKKKELESLGYETFMLMLYVSPITSLERNKSRDRSLLPNIVLRTWRDVFKNIEIYQNEFGNNFSLINNNPDDSNNLFNPDDVYKNYIEPLEKIGKEKSPEEKEKSKQEKEKLYADISSLISKDLKFDTISQAKQKLNLFLNK